MNQFCSRRVVAVAKAMQAVLVSVDLPRHPTAHPARFEHKAYWPTLRILGDEQLTTGSKVIGNNDLRQIFDDIPWSIYDRP